MSEIQAILRRLVRAPGFTVISSLTLALGIGVNVAIFSLVNGVLLRQLPYPEAERLMVISHDAPGLNLDSMGVSPPLYLRYRDEALSFESVALVREGRVNLTGVEVPTRLSLGTVSASLFPALKVGAAHGRVFTEEDEKLGAPPVVLLSEALWRERFGADEGIMGQTLELDGKGHEVIGILPQRFEFPTRETEVWLPRIIDLEKEPLGSFGSSCLARLRPGVSRQGALADLRRFTENLTKEFPEDGAAGVLARSEFFPTLTPLLEEVVGEESQILWIILGAVGIVLLMACANVANLFLVRAEGRQRELAVRTALGASRRRLARSFLIEGLTLALLGGFLAVGLAHLGMRALVQLEGVGIPRLHEVTIDVNVLLFALAMSLASAMLFAFLPVLQHGAPNLAASLKEGGRGTSRGRNRARIRHVLVVAQVALGLLVVICAGLLVRSFQQLSQVDPGFEPQGALSLSFALPSTTYDSPEATARFVDQVVARLEGLAAVSDVAAASALPLTGHASASGYELDGFPLAEDEPPPIFMFKYVSPGFLKALGIPLVEGRDLEPADHQQPTGSVVISQSIAQQYWPQESAIGKRLRPGRSQDERWYTVVGVAGNVREQRLQEDPSDFVYYAMVGLEGYGGLTGSVSLVMRTPGDPKSLAQPAKREIWSLDPNLPITQVRTLEEIVEATTARARFSMLLLLLASGLALGLGGIGIYGVISYQVSQRTQEIGLRLALGARGGQVRAMVVKHGLLMAVAGIALGLLGAVALTRLMQAWLFGVGPLDPYTFASVPLLLVAVALLASFLPALRASRLDPLQALRHE